MKVSKINYERLVNTGDFSHENTVLRLCWVKAIRPKMQSIMQGS